MALRARHAGLRRLDGRPLPGRACGARGALLLGPRIGRFGKDGRANPIPGHNLPFAIVGTIILWFGWFGFNPGSTLGVVTGDRLGFFGYVALTTNLAAAAGALGGVVCAWLVLRRPDITMMLNGVLAGLVAVTAACGFVAPWAAVAIGFVAGSIAVVGVLVVERLRIDDPIGAVAVPSLAATLGVGGGGLLYTGDPRQLGVQALGLVVVGAFTFTASFAALWAMKAAWSIRAEPETEHAGFDRAEHGTVGYPEWPTASLPYLEHA